MNNDHKIMEAYLEMTGQTLEYVMSGGMQYGPVFIYKLAEQALEENKSILWKAKLVNGEDFGLLSYKLLPIQNKR